MYCGNQRLLETAKSNHYDLVQFCIVEWSQLGPAMRASTERTPDLEDVGRDWKIWYEEESRRRTGYCIWVGSLFLSV
jgi:hypothetical protein